MFKIIFTDKYGEEHEFHDVVYFSISPEYLYLSVHNYITRAFYMKNIKDVRIERKENTP